MPDPQNAAAAKMPDDVIRVMVVDDSAVIRGLLTRALESDPRIRVVRTVPNGRAAINVAKSRPLDIVVLDIEMPVMNGMEALPQIIAAAPKSK